MGAQYWYLGTFARLRNMFSPQFKCTIGYRTCCLQYYDSNQLFFFKAILFFGLALKGVCSHHCQCWLKASYPLAILPLHSGISHKKLQIAPFLWLSILYPHQLAFMTESRKFPLPCGNRAWFCNQFCVSVKGQWDFRIFLIKRMQALLKQ